MLRRSPTTTAVCSCTWNRSIHEQMDHPRGILLQRWPYAIAISTYTSEKKIHTITLPHIVQSCIVKDSHNYSYIYIAYQKCTTHNSAHVFNVMYCIALHCAVRIVMYCTYCHALYLLSLIDMCCNVLSCIQTNGTIAQLYGLLYIVSIVGIVCVVTNCLYCHVLSGIYMLCMLWMFSMLCNLIIFNFM